MQKVRVGIIGCGAISNAYLNHAKVFPILEMAACADLDMERAKARAAEYNVPTVHTVDALLADPSIDVVLNLTVPKAHVPVALAALRAGKHTYAEKPLGISREEARPLLALAKEKNLRVGCAPDTVLGAGHQTARKLLDDGAIGKPIAFTAFMMCPGHEHWHPSPEFYYEVGGGPMFDMGPYYLTALLNLLGPVKRITALAGTGFAERTITSQPKAGKRVKVETPTHIAGSMEFANGCVGTLVTSFDTRFAEYNNKQPITIFGTDGTLRVPDPNGFDGPVHLRKKGGDDWTEIPPAFPAGYGRATGLADLAHAIRSGRKARCDLNQAFTVLDLMQGFLDAASTGTAHTPSIPYERPALMPAHLPFGVLDE